MHDKTCLITGASAGIGQATATQLAQQGATVAIVARNPQRGQAALAHIRQRSGNPNITLHLADLSSQAAIRQLAAEITARHPALHVLINNAATIPQQHTLTEDGLEMQFAVNHLSYFLLTNLLLDHLKASAPARIINVSSSTHTSATLNLDDLQSARRSYHPTHVYAATKLANILFTHELARRLQGTGITVNALSPGVVATKLLSDYMGNPGARPRMGSAPEQGARTPVYLATSPEVAHVTGKYFADCRQTPAASQAHDGDTARRLWEVSAELCGLMI